ncbi:SDR family NAD(P)-dependent oxidoreductase [Tannockella kyphosi]|uniref:SDR family NAD(P)-dependent oxidoreductase n=1 Tax=Tannockella kyphosi TaxID=2899121 RepID=UPI002011A56D|nr:SDR family NAD(P)-dependent oxidoreductase [Tannockella kyphosi]
MKADRIEIILVTGAAGFIGSHLCEQLLREGINVIGIDSFNSYYDVEIKKNNVKLIEATAKDNGKNFQMLTGDIRDTQFLNTVFSKYKIDAIVSLAANAGVRPSIEEPLEYISVNLDGLTKLLECAKNYGIKKFIFASSSSVYGNNRKTPFSEEDPVDNPISPYAATKKAGELICYTYHSLYDINIACLRYFTVYGPRQRPDLAINKFTRLIFNGSKIEMYGDGSTARDYTYVSDVVSGTIAAINYLSRDESIYDIFNLGGSNPIKLIDLIDLIAKTLNKPVEIITKPMQPGDVEVTFSDFSRAQEKLNYYPQVTIEKGIENFVRWYVKNSD